MKPKTFMLIAGEPSGDLLGAELVEALRAESAAGLSVFTTDYQPLYGSFEPRFIGAGGPHMAKAGVQLALDLTRHSVVGLSDVLTNLLKFRRLLHQLCRLAFDRQPDAIVFVDFSGFNRRLARAIKRRVRKRLDWFHDWDPKLVQYVSPQVWASREGRARQMAQDYDLLLSIFPFEREWYASRVPQLRVEYVGHPMVDRYATLGPVPQTPGSGATLVLLPGSRPAEIARHLPVMLRSVELLTRTESSRTVGTQSPASMREFRTITVLPNEALARRARSLHPPESVSIQVGGLPTALATADLAIACTGTVTMECAWFGVPVIALYKTSWANYQIARRIVKVPFLAMPNLLANEELFPEFIQKAATPENIADAACDLLRDESRRERLKAKLAGIVATLGGPGASRRAAKSILALIPA